MTKKTAQENLELTLSHEIDALQNTIKELTEDLNTKCDEARHLYCEFIGDDKKALSAHFKFTRTERIKLDPETVQGYYMKHKDVRGLFKLTIPLSKALDLKGLAYETTFTKASVKAK